MFGRDQYGNKKDWNKPDRWVLVCVNGLCQARIPIGYPRSCLDKCPLCGCPMSCRRE